jgi:branched-chain amino acid transport system substrate-binding protein
MITIGALCTRVRALACLAWIMPGLMLAAGPARSDDNPIKIGLAVAESGFIAAYDADGAKAVQLWVDDQNAAGGLLGRKLTTMLTDTKSDRTEGAKIGKQMVDDGASLVVVTCDYDYGSPAAIAAQRGGVISMFLCAEDPKAGVQGAGAYAFTASVAAQVQGAAIGEWAYANLKVRNAYVLLDTAIEYDKSVCAGFEWAWHKLKDATIVGSDTFKNGDESIQAQITRIKSLTPAPEAIVLCSLNPGGGSATRQIRAAGLEMPILSGGAMDGAYWLNAVPNLSKFYLVAQASIYGDDPRGDIQAFNARFKAKFGAAPVTHYAYPAYAWLQLWAKAVQKTGTLDAGPVVKVMETFKDEPTLLGPRTFTSQLHIQNNAPYLVMEIENGKPRFVGQQQIAEPVPFEVLFRIKK